MFGQAIKTSKPYYRIESITVDDIHHTATVLLENGKRFQESLSSDCDYAFFPSCKAGNFVSNYDEKIIITAHPMLQNNVDMEVVDKCTNLQVGSQEYSELLCAMLPRVVAGGEIVDRCGYEINAFFEGHTTAISHSNIDYLAVSYNGCTTYFSDYNA